MVKTRAVCRIIRGLAIALLLMQAVPISQAQTHVSARPPGKAVLVAVRNRSDEKRVEDVVLRVSELQRVAPDFNAATASVRIDEAQAQGKGSSADTVELPSQADDLDGDGKPDELAFQVELLPKETRIVTIDYGAAGNASSRVNYPQRTAARFSKHYDGMGWESENTAWRLYFDKRNAIDLWGKRKPGLYLETFAAPDYKYQEESPIGRDIYNVGKSLGAGGVGAWVDGHALPVADVSSRNWRIVSAGPVRSIVEFKYEGWKVGDHSVTLTSRITQWAGERGYEHRVTLHGSEAFPLVVGISRKPGLTEVKESSCSLGIWGHQVVKPGTGATDSLPDQNLGLALVVPDAPNDCRLAGDPLNYVVKPQIKDGAARWYVLAAWDQEENKPVKSVKDFKALVDHETARLAKPALIEVLTRPPESLSSASTTPSSPAAADAVKYFPSADVHASFEKGTPLLNKDRRSYWVITGRREQSGQSELHEKETDVFYVLQGSATFVTGGKMVDPKTTAPGEVRGTGIEGGEARTLSKDDVIVIPAGVPHWFKDVQGTFLYFVVKVQ